MKKTYTLVFVGLMMLFSTLFTGCGSAGVTTAVAAETTSEVRQPDLFEKAVAIIKKYETLHKPKHWPLVGYGHKVLPGEKFSRTKALSEKEADALLRKDLKKLCAIYRSYGQDSILLATLAYNLGHGAVNRSSVVSKLKAGDRNIEKSYISYCRYRGKEHAQIKRRRIEEFETLFVDNQTMARATPTEVPLLLRPFIVHEEEPKSITQRLAEAVVHEEETLRAALIPAIQDPKRSS